MRCASCGYETPNKNERFCEACGKPVNAGFANLSKLERSPASAVLSPTPPQASSSDRFGAGNTKTVKGAPARWQQMGWAALAILLYLTIADAAAETFLRDSPLRWWIAGTAFLYLALCVTVWRLLPKLWRRLNWANQTALSILVLLALMSASAWMPGGLEQGLNLFGQSTSIVLAIVSAVAVAISGILLARLRFVPLAGRIVAGLLAAYGVAAFLLAVRDGTSYATLFHGASLWTRLPFWLQGATIGGLFVVPVALLLELVTGLPRIARAKISEFGFKVTALGMSLVIIVAAVRTPAAYDATGIETPPWLSRTHDKLPQGEAGYKQASEKFNRFYAGLDVVNSRMDRSLFEIDALAARLGSDPATIFHFVRDEIRFEPYTGVLRGALGALICRAGNALDRSLLLAVLLEKAGLNTQIASGRLTAQEAQILVNRLFEPVRPVRSVVPSFAELAPDLSRSMGVDQAKLLEMAEEAQKYADKQEKDLLNYVNSETALLSSQLTTAGAEAGVISTNDRLVAEASEHYWVQYQDPSGRWVDLDSAFNDAEPGKTVVSATNTFSPDSVPEELYHHLQITLTLRVAQVADGKDGSANDTVLLSQELRVADQQGKDIMIGNAPVPMPSATNAGMSLAQAFEPTKGYQTVLQVGSQVTSGKYFDLDGQTSDGAPGSAEGAAAANAGGIGKSLGGLGGSMSGALSGESSQAITTRIVGEWVSYLLTSPGIQGEQPSVRDYRRDIISTGNPQSTLTRSGRDALRIRLMWFVDLLPVTGAFAPGYSGYLQAEAFQPLISDRALSDNLLKAAFGLAPGQAEPRPPRGRVPVRAVLLAAGAAGTARALCRARFPALRAYFKRPGLIAYERAGASTTTGAAFAERYDIVSFPLSVSSDPNDHADDSRQAAASFHVLQGVLATRLEWVLLAESDLSSGSTRQGTFNATEVFRAARDQGIRTIVLRPGAAGLAQLAAASLPEPITTELAKSLRAGRTLVFPTRPLRFDGRPQFAWWQVDDSSGEVIGIMPGGRGQAGAEYGMQMTIATIGGLACLIDARKEMGGTGVVGLKLFGCAFGVYLGMTALPEFGALFMAILGLEIALVEG